MAGQSWLADTFAGIMIITAAYCVSRLVVARRQALNTLEGQRRPPGLLLARKTVELLSRSRLTCSHDELRYVIRKPEDRFARVL